MARRHAGAGLLLGACVTASLVLAARPAAAFGPVVAVPPPVTAPPATPPAPPASPPAAVDAAPPYSAPMTPPAAPATPTTPAAPPWPPPPPGQPPPWGSVPPPWVVPVSGVTVEVRADRPGLHVDRLVGDNNFVLACLAPCRQMLPRNEIYVIQGAEIPATARFLLPDDRDRVTLDVHAGSSSRQTAGSAMMLGGIAAAFIGYFVLTAATAADNPVGSDVARNRTIGLAMVGGGVVMAAFGFSVRQGGQTTVQSSSGARF